MFYKRCLREVLGEQKVSRPATVLKLLPGKCIKVAVQLYEDLGFCLQVELAIDFHHIMVDSQ